MNRQTFLMRIMWLATGCFAAIVLAACGGIGGSSGLLGTGGQLEQAGATAARGAPGFAPEVGPMAQGVAEELWIIATPDRTEQMVGTIEEDSPGSGAMLASLLPDEDQVELRS